MSALNRLGLCLAIWGVVFCISASNTNCKHRDAAEITGIALVCIGTLELVWNSARPTTEGPDSQ